LPFGRGVMYMKEAVDCSAVSIRFTAAAHGHPEPWAAVFISFSESNLERNAVSKS
jgi:hypothetical protein